MNAGTILYIPVAQAEGGATVTVKGQLYGPTLKLDGTDITTGTAVTIATDSTRYVPLSVEGTGSLYLTGIAIDYAAGSPAATSHTVTVGPNGQYRTIQAALDANDSSETDRLVLKITPGDYREKITVTKPGVTFANADVTAKRAVTIRASYYSSNTFDADGKFVPQDEFDLAYRPVGEFCENLKHSNFPFLTPILLRECLMSALSTLNSLRFGSAMYSDKKYGF